MGTLEGRMHTITDIARFLNVSKRTVQRMIKRGELRAYRIGGVMRIPPHALEQLLRGDDVFDPHDESHLQLDLFN
mgnify:FL=1